MPEAVNIEIEALIKELQKLKECGIKELQLQGTLIVKGKGNLVLHTNEKQW